jgi:hypothetical protein
MDHLRLVSVSLLLGAASGALCLGVGGRLAMRAFALATARPPGFSLGGTLGVIFAGAIAGLLGSVIYLVVRRLLPSRLGGRGLAFSLLCYAAASPGFRPPEPLVFALFAPTFLAYGFALVAAHCRLAGTAAYSAGGDEGGADHRR